MINKTLEVNEKTIRIDHEGYLLEPSDWNKEVALAIAEKEGIKMTDDVWEVVLFVRDHFESNQCIPEHRRLLQALRKNTVKKKQPENMYTICFHMVMVSRPAKLQVCACR